MRSSAAGWILPCWELCFEASRVSLLHFSCWDSWCWVWKWSVVVLWDLRKAYCRAALTTWVVNQDVSTSFPVPVSYTCSSTQVTHSTESAQFILVTHYVHLFYELTALIMIMTHTTFSKSLAQAWLSNGDLFHTMHQLVASKLLDFCMMLLKKIFLWSKDDAMEGQCYHKVASFQ